MRNLRSQSTCLLRTIRLRQALLVCAVLLLGISQATAASARLADQRSIIFQRLGTSDGLSQGVVFAIAQDDEGYLWFGTQEGLNKYDGQSFESFYHFDEPGSLSHDQILSLLVDSRGILWVGTDGGLNRLNEDGRTFSRVDIGFPNQASSIYALAEDGDGNLWVGSSRGLTKIAQVGSVETLTHERTDASTLIRGSVRSIYIANDGALWIGTGDGGLALHLGGDRFERYMHEPGNTDSLPDNNVRAITEDLQGNLWVATFSGGVAVLDRENGSWRRFRADGRPGSLASNRIRSLMRDQLGNIWVGTDSGLNLWVEKSNQFLRFSLDLTNPRTLSHNLVMELFQDRGGVVWVGTFDGISRWNAKVGSFPHFKLVGNRQKTVTASTTSFAEDDSEDVWIGTLAGINRWNSSTAQLEALSAIDIGLSDERVMALVTLTDEVWAGTMAGGVNVIRDDIVTQVHNHDPQVGDTLSSNAISSFYKDSIGDVWVTTYGGGVNRYLGEGRFQRFPSGNNKYGDFADLRTLDIVEAPDGSMWIATDGGGVVVLDPVSGDTYALRHDPSDSKSVSSDNILTLLRHGDTLWVGTRDRGLNKYDPEIGGFVRFGKSKGLASDAVFGMLVDSLGKIWISGSKGLSVLDTESGKIEVYDSTHGLQSDDFNSGAFAELSDGSFAFGGNNGFNVFDPTRIRRNPHVPEVVLTGFSKFNKPFLLERPISAMDELVLDYTDTVIGFEFVSMDFTAPAKNQYRYKLEGFDPDWVDAEGARSATYTNLDSGEYVFRVIGSNNDGLWNETGASIRVRVNPPLWATWWAYAIYTVIAAIVLWQVIRANSRRQRHAAEQRYSERLQLYIESLEEATDCVMIADNQGSVMYANHAAESVLGKSPQFSLGQPLVEVLFDDADDTDAALAALEDVGRYHGEVSWRRSDGDNVATDITVAVVRESSEEGAAYVAIARDITQRKKTESELENHRRNLEFLVGERTRALEKEIAENKANQLVLANSLEEKELLLKEVHHRVKNNMQVISSLLNIQAETVGNESFATLLGESQQRIKSMSLIHENLYQSENLLEINFEDYIRMLANSLARFYIVPGVNVQIDVQVEDVSLDIEMAVPCGLIINELVSNSLKHAFNEREGMAHIGVSFINKQCQYQLRICDDGCGLPEDFSLTNPSSMGMEIVSILTEQLDGELKVLEAPGAAFEISIPRKEMHER